MKVFRGPCQHGKPGTLEMPPVFDGVYRIPVVLRQRPRCVKPVKGFIWCDRPLCARADIRPAPACFHMPMESYDCAAAVLVPV